MNLEDLQLIDNEPINISKIKGDSLERNHQQGANLNDSNQDVEFTIGENNN